MAQIYDDGTYLDNNPTWHEEDSPWKAKWIKTIVEKNNLAPKRICEIGCGVGEILNLLSDSYSEKEFFGYEISPQAYEIARTKEKNNLSFKLQNLLENNQESFDLAMAIDVFEHVEDYFGFLRAPKEKAEYKIYHIPLDLSVQNVLRSHPIIDGRKTVGHIHYFTKETALESLKDTGHEIIDYVYTPGTLVLPNQSWKSKLAKMPRKLAYAINQDLAVRVLGGYSLLVLTK